MDYNVIIIGAGAAGLFAASNISIGKVIILEKNKTAGKKLLIAGGGRCNFTNLTSREEMINHYFEKKNFVKPLIYNFPPEKLIPYFNRYGLKTYTDRDNRVFPKSMTGIDILNLFLKLSGNNSTKIIYSNPVTRVEKIRDKFQVKSNKGVFNAPFLVITTGGKSYSGTGSTGDGYKFARSLGHRIIFPEPALTPLKISNNSFGTFSGVTLKEKRIAILRKGQKIAEKVGDILFTHNGLSGPAILDLSRMIKSGDLIEVVLARFPNKGLLLEDFKKKLIKNGKKRLVNHIKLYDIPYKLASFVVKMSGLNSSIKCGNLNKNEIERIVDNLFLRFKIDKKFGFNKAMVTKGGVDTSEINPNSMESRLVDGLYFAGEVIDVDGESGGYNLHFAFSSGKLVAENINER